MKKRIIIVLGILIAAGGIGTGVWYHFYGNTQGKTGDSIVYVSKVSVISGTETAAVNRFAGVVEPQKTVNVKIESGRKVKEVEVKTGEEVKAGQLLFEYDLSSIEDDLKQAQLDLDRLKNEQISLTEQISTLEAEKKKATNTYEVPTSKNLTTFWNIPQFWNFSQFQFPKFNFAQPFQLFFNWSNPLILFHCN